LGIISTDLEETGVEDGAVETNEAPVSEPKDKEAKKRKAADSENKHPDAELSRGAVVDRKIKDGISRALGLCNSSLNFCMTRLKRMILKDWSLLQNDHEITVLA